MIIAQKRIVSFGCLVIVTGISLILLESMTDYYDLRYIQITTGLITPEVYSIIVYNLYNWLPWMVLSFYFYPESSLLNALQFGKKKITLLLLKFVLFLTAVPFLASIMLNFSGMSRGIPGIWSDFVYSGISNLYKYLLGIVLVLIFTLLFEFKKNFKRFAESVNKFKEERDKIIEKLNSEDKSEATISVKIGNQIKVIKLSDVIWFESENYYVWINLPGGKRFLIRESIKSLEKTLPDNFLRIDRGVIINLNELDKVYSEDGKYFSVLNTGDTHKVARSRIPSLRKKVRTGIN